MVGKAERHIDADEEGLVGYRVEIGAKLGVPAEALGKIAIGRIGEARKQKQHEGRRHLMSDDQPHDERHQDDARQRQRVRDIHEGSNSRLAALKHRLKPLKS